MQEEIERLEDLIIQLETKLKEKNEEIKALKSSRHDEKYGPLGGRFVPKPADYITAGCVFDDTAIPTFIAPTMDRVYVRAGGDGE